MFEGVLVAIITAVGAIVAASIQAMRKENKEDHGLVRASLTRIETKLDDHIDDHLKGAI